MHLTCRKHEYAGLCTNARIDWDTPITGIAGRCGTVLMLAVATQERVSRYVAWIHSLRRCEEGFLSRVFLGFALRRMGKVDDDYEGREDSQLELGTNSTMLDSSEGTVELNGVSAGHSPLGGYVSLDGRCGLQGTSPLLGGESRSPRGNMPSGMAYQRYRPWKEFVEGLPTDELWSPTKRKWPSRRPTKAPRWCSVDLRDGNQALERPMGVAEKLQMFDMLVYMGFREIEIGFPSASQTDFDFCRLIVERTASRRATAPPWLMVLVPARAELIRKTIAAMKGAPRVIIHLYNSTSELQRRVVFQLSVEGVEKLAVDSALLIRDLAERELIATGSCVRYQYSPESFTGTEVAVALQISESVARAFGASAKHPLILNLPETVQNSPPNFYADQIEWMHLHLTDRERFIISLHPHNDRGCAVASAELALLAGAERVEGCLFGNGERTGNVCLVTLALNLLHLGIDPELDLRDLPGISAVFERCTHMLVPPRQPWAGELVYTAFSGSHQDAIKKGLTALRRNDAIIKDLGQPAAAYWEVPYLPIDPADVGRHYEAIVRINSQSGKGGVAFVLEHDYGITLPRGLQIEFSAVVQQICDTSGEELESRAVLDLFRNTYIPRRRPVDLLAYRVASHHSKMPAGWCLAPAKGFNREAIHLWGSGGNSSRNRNSSNCPYRHHHHHHHHHNHNHSLSNTREHQSHGHHRRPKEISPRNNGVIRERVASPHDQMPPLLKLLGDERGSDSPHESLQAARNAPSPTSRTPSPPTVSAIAVALETAVCARSGSQNFQGCSPVGDDQKRSGSVRRSTSVSSFEAVGRSPPAGSSVTRIRSSVDDPAAEQLSRQLGLFQPFVAASDPFGDRDYDAPFRGNGDEASAHSSGSSVDDVERVRIEALVRVRMLSRDAEMSLADTTPARSERAYRTILPPSDETLRISGSGNGPLSAFVTAVNSLKPHFQRDRWESMVSNILPVEIIGYFEQSVTSGSTAEAICFVHIAQWIVGHEDGSQYCCGDERSPSRQLDSSSPVRLTAWGVSQHPNSTTASVSAFCNALARMTSVATTSTCSVPRMSSLSRSGTGSCNSPPRDAAGNRGVRAKRDDTDPLLDRVDADESRLTVGIRAVVT